jgi:hypothetical protein
MRHLRVAGHSYLSREEVEELWEAGGSKGAKP